jgi:hypothetical protein
MVVSMNDRPQRFFFLFAAYEEHDEICIVQRGCTKRDPIRFEALHPVRDHDARFSPDLREDPLTARCAKYQGPPRMPATYLSDLPD